MSASPLPKRSELQHLAGPDFFCWATGIEDTFITAPHAVTGRTLDEYELTGHYKRWRGDLDLMASLGVRAARYGVPWHRIQPGRHRWEWRYADEPLERLLELGIAPQVDLIHYGLPAWIERAYLHPDYPAYAADYAARLAERFKGRIHWYTPLNEPRITAWYCGRLGWWPPHERSWSGFARVLFAAVAGIQRTVAALRNVDPEIVAYHVDATDLYESDEAALAEEVKFRRNIVYLALDLASGRIGGNHPLHGWLVAALGGSSAFDGFQARAIEPDVIGLNLYPLFTRKVLKRDKAGRFRIRMPYTETGLIQGVARGYHERFGRPMMISEVATSGSAARRLHWLETSIAAVKETRAQGIPLTGYTWWPMFALVTWAWRQGRRPVKDHLLQMGLWDLDADLNRVPTAVAERYRELASGGAATAGRLAPAHAAQAKEFS